MIGISGISYHIPPDSIDNEDQAKKFSLSDEFIEKRIGIKKLPIKNYNQDTSDLAIQAIMSLKKEYEFGPLIHPIRNSNNVGPPQLFLSISVGGRHAIFTGCARCTDHSASSRVVRGRIDTSSA